jgi:hypothetical protein
METRHAAIYDIVEEIQPCGVRQAFYQTVVRGLMDKTEADYDKVQRALVQMRRDDIVPYSWIVDAGRWQHKPTSYTSVEQALQDCADSYRRDVWHDRDVRVEIWLEKEGLAGTILPVTSEYDVPLYVSRGFSSLTYLANAADAIETCGKPTFIYHCGDHDEWGRDAGAHIERDLRALAPTIDIHFERIAVTTAQIKTWSLPTRPLKSDGKMRARFEAEHGNDGAVELDAINPDDLRQLVRDAIERHISPQEMDVVRAVETQDRERLASLTILPSE